MATSADTYATVPLFQPDEKRHRQAISTWARQAHAGKIPVVGNVTLVALTASTVVTDARAAMNSYIHLTPTNAKGLSANPTVYVSVYGDGSFTVAHSVSIATTKNFRYLIMG